MCLHRYSLSYERGVKRGVMYVLLYHPGIIIIKKVGWIENQLLIGMDLPTGKIGCFIGKNEVL